MYHPVFPEMPGTTRHLSIAEFFYAESIEWQTLRRRPAEFSSLEIWAGMAPYT